MSADDRDPRVVRGMQQQLAQRRARIEAGEQPIGWKVGFGAPAAMQAFKITAPLIGFLMKSARIESGGEASLSGWVKPVAEPEIAVYLGRDLAGSVTRAETAAAIAALGPAIELADLTAPPTDVEAILAGNIYQRHVVLGPRSEAHAGGRVEGLSGCLFRRGAGSAASEDLESNTGRLIDIVAHVARELASEGERLRGRFHHLRLGDAAAVYRA